MLNSEELKTFMNAVAASDRRTTGKADVQFWAAMAHEGGWTLGTAMRALVQFRGRHAGEWLEPGHITEIVREARRAAATTFAAPDPPDDLPRRQYPAWLRNRRDEHIRRVLDAWADGAAMPVTEQTCAELVGSERATLTAGLDTSTCPCELREQLERDFKRIGQEQPGPRPTVTPPRRMAGDAQRREQARAELAGRQPTPSPETDGEEAA
ncbi:MAG: hypothetical protein GEU83_18230 [Pseudonocardiaceae bacterium]|nr:hypothetical protein [Pseudonocardiaceae bacterium]